MLQLRVIKEREIVVVFNRWQRFYYFLEENPKGNQLRGASEIKSRFKGILEVVKLGNKPTKFLSS